MDQNQEREIIGRVLMGEREAYALLVETYKGPVFNLAFRMTGSYQDADDLTQETFIRAYQKLRQFNQEKKFFTWLYTIALSIIKNHLRKNKRNRLSVKPPDSGIDLYEENHLDDLNISACLARLDFKYRVLIIMRYQQELSFEEISQITSKSISAIKMSVYRGLEKLKEMIKE